MNTHTLICNYCQTSYESKYKPKKGRPNYCSRTCSNKATPRRKPTHKCIQCSTPITANRKFCSESCRDKFRATNNLKRKEQLKQNVVSFRQRQKLKAIEYKGGKCQGCGYAKCSAALEFHHIDPSLKDFHLAEVTKSWDIVKLELDKCVLLCANCHREVHAGIRDIGCTSG